MKKTTILVLFTLVFFSYLNAQEKEEEKKGFDKEKLFFGGNFGLSFGDYTLINISPQLGYRFNNYFAAGAGVNLQFISLKYRDINNNVAVKESKGVVGLNIFGRVYPIQYIMLQAQPELNYIFGKQKFYNPTEEYKLDASIVPSLLLGGGLVLPSGRGAFVASVFYDVLNNANSPYGKKAFLNFSYNIGF